LLILTEKCYNKQAIKYSLEGIMGKGDKRTKRGKIWRGTFGKCRPAVATKSTATASAAK
jgi:30S ribosomal protein S31